jgi:SagB-type dehydrogenase family enzyme
MPFLIVGAALGAALLASAVRAGDDFRSIELPKPQMKGGMPLMEALSARRSTREYDTRALSPQMLSDLLWAAFGINRPESGKRTAPSAMNRQETDIYVAMREGLYLYNARENRLDPVLAEDIRESTGMQDFVRDAPVNLVFVADFSKMGDAADKDKTFYAAAGVGFISQNVYLFCASNGLATVVRAWVDKEKLRQVMRLRPDQHIILTQTVGYPKKQD